MNNIYKKITIIAISILGLSSCEDKLDLGVQGAISPDLAYQTTSDLNLALNGAYASWSPENDINFSSTFTDLLRTGPDNGGFQLGVHRFLLNSGTGISTSIFNSNHGIVNRANRILAAAENITPEDAEEQELYNSIVGQAYALRAHANLKIVSYFSTDYNDDNALAGFLVIDEVPTQGAKKARATTGEFFTSINSDLETAAALIPDSQTNNSYITKDYITGLKARIALMRNNDADALTYSSELVAKYNLADVSGYVDMFKEDSNDDEIIMKLNRLSGGFGELFELTNGAIRWETAVGITSSLESPDDVRFQVLYDLSNPDFSLTPGDFFTPVGKYLGRSGTPFLNDMKVMRVAEMYLIKAEAEAKTGDLASAATTMQTLKDIRNDVGPALPVNYADLEEALTDILNERKIELALEGHRFLDLKRLGNELQIGIERDANDCGGNIPCSLPYNDYRFTLPIPQNEINVQPDLPQNPGY